MAETGTEDPPQGQGVVSQLSQLWRKLTPRRRTTLVAAVVGTLVLVAAMSFSGSVETYSPLFTGMAPEDAGEIIEVLKERGISYKLSSNGSTVEVPKAKLDEVRLSLASSGFPRGGGVGFEIFDKQNFGTTSFVEKINYRRALQGELSRSIVSISAVKAARVHLAMGQRSVFRDNDEPPSASVALRLRQGRTLKAGEVQGIVHLVASSVDGLEPGQVVVIDERGKVLSSGDVESESGSGSDAQNKIETNLENRVRHMVETVVGVGNAAVVVTAEMDYSRVDKTEEMYDKDNIAIRSEVRNVNRDGGKGGTVGGIAGARANLDGTGTTAVEAPSGGNSSISETRNYEVPRIIKHTVGPASSIKRLHVAVLVNHKEIEVPVEVAVVEEPKKKKGKKGKKSKKDEEPEEAAEPEMKKERVALTEDELGVIAAIAKQAAGLDDERGDKLEVRNVLFENQEVVAPEEALATSAPLFSKRMFYIASGVAGLLLIVVVLFLIRRSPGAMRAEMVALPAPISEVERVFESRRSQRELPAAKEDQPDEVGSQNGDLYGRVLTSVRADAGHAARVFSALLDDTSKEGA